MSALERRDAAVPEFADLALSDRAGGTAPGEDGTESTARGRRSLYALPDAAPAARRGPFVLLLVLLLGGGLTGLLLLNTQLQQGTFTLSTLQARQATLDDDAQVLSQQVSALQAPQAIWSAATAMGLVPAADPQFLRVGEKPHLSSAPAITAVPRAPSAAEVARAKVLAREAAAAKAAKAAKAREAAAAEARAAAAARARAAAAARATAAPRAGAVGAAARPGAAPTAAPTATSTPAPTTTGAAR